MAYRNKVDQAAAARRYYERNKDLVKARAAAYRDQVREEIRQYLIRIREESPCVDCRQYFPYYVMDFDHLRDKVFNLNDAKRRLPSLAVLKQEIAKCEVVCANCHRERTYRRKEVATTANRNSLQA